MNSLAENLQSMLCIQPIRPQSNIDNIEKDLAQAMEASSSDILSSELATFLQYMEEHGDKASQELAACVDQLQELFLGSLHQVFQLAGVTVDSRMIISLDRHGKLQIETACAEQEHIEDFFSSSKALPVLFKLLSVQSAILDGITHLRQVAETHKSGDSEKLSQVQQAYRVCLKGQLSHFYSM